METATSTRKAVASAQKHGEIWLTMNPGETIEAYVLEGGWSITHLENMTTAFGLQGHPEVSALLTALRREKRGTRLLNSRERARIIEACDRDSNAIRGLRDRALLSLRMPAAVDIIALTRETAPLNVEMQDWLAYWSGDVIFPVMHYGRIRPDQTINVDAIKAILRRRAWESGISDAGVLSVAALRTPVAARLHVGEPW